MEQFEMHKFCTSSVIVFAMTFYLDLRVLESFGILYVYLLCLPLHKPCTDTLYYTTRYSFFFSLKLYIIMNT